MNVEQNSGNPKKYLITVVGPTAIGKTALAIQLAQYYRTEIISADSRQFYKEMYLGTAVPSPGELMAIPHHFIQHKSIFEPYSVGDFERDAKMRIASLFEKQPIVIMVGGSGLYIDSVLKGLDQFPEVAPEIREQLKEQFLKEGIGALQAQLKEVDPDYFREVDLQNSQRIIRALEVYIAVQKPYSSFLGKRTGARNFSSIIIGLNADREIVYDRIHQRVDVMMAKGLIAEAKQLYPYKDLNALQTVGYKELFLAFDGHCTLEEAIFEIKKNTRRFAKRQGTWFRRYPDIIWYDYQSPLSHITNLIDTKIDI